MNALSDETSTSETPSKGTTTIPDNKHAQIATADVLTLLLHNQHALAAAIEEVALWAISTGSPETHDNVIAALETIDRNASAVSDAINQIRQL